MHIWRTLGKNQGARPLPGASGALQTGSPEGHALAHGHDHDELPFPEMDVVEATERAVAEVSALAETLTERRLPPGDDHAAVGTSLQRAQRCLATSANEKSNSDSDEDSDRQGYWESVAADNGLPDMPDNQSLGGGGSSDDGGNHLQDTLNEAAGQESEIDDAAERAGASTVTPTVNDADGTRGRLQAERIAEIFSIFGSTRAGRLDRHDLKLAMHWLGCGPLTDDRVAHFVSWYGDEQTGLVSYGAFEQIVLRCVAAEGEDNTYIPATLAERSSSLPVATVERPGIEPPVFW